MATITGTIGADTLIGGAIGDYVSGGPAGAEATDVGADSLQGGAGRDTVFGWGGADTLRDDAGRDSLDGGEGDDAIFTNADGGIVSGGNGADSILGGREFDEIDGDGGADTIDGGLSFDFIDGGEGDDRIRVHEGYGNGGGGGDTIIGTGLSSFRNLHGDDGDDYLSTQGFAFVSGDAGADTLIGRFDGQTLLGRDGNDLVNGGIGNDTLLGEADDDVLLGGDGDDSLDGGTGNDILVAGPGTDTMLGGIGDDVYLVRAAGVTLIENAAEGLDLVSSSVAWTLGDDFENLNLLDAANITGTGNALANRLAGNAGANLLLGLPGDDVILGRSGADTLDGGEGRDVLTGGADADTFLFGAPSHGVDRVADFAPREDGLAFVAATFGGLPLGAVGPANFVAHAAHTATSAAGVPQFIYHTGVGVLSFDVDGTGGATAVRMATLVGAPAIAAGDLTIVA